MNRDPVNLGEQVGPLLPRLRRFARALTRHPHDADDLVQVAIERALRHQKQWRPGSSLLDWMLGIVHNAFIDETRKARRREIALAREAASVVASASDERMHDIESWSLQAALERLPEDQRVAVALVLVEGLSYQEAAEVMEVPVGTLTSRVARARSALKKILKEIDAPRAASGSPR
jgi:RNA polymerase sigma-70 factor (ECF subfamily)